MAGTNPLQARNVSTASDLHKLQPLAARSADFMLRAVQQVQRLRHIAAQTRAYRVCIADPRIVLNEPEKALHGTGSGLTIDVPDAFVDKLSLGAQPLNRVGSCLRVATTGLSDGSDVIAGELSLGDADDPENSWVFGRKVIDEEYHPTAHACVRHNGKH